MTALPAEFFPNGPITPAERALEAALNDQTAPAWLLTALGNALKADPAEVVEYLNRLTGLFEDLRAERYGYVGEALDDQRTRH